MRIALGIVAGETPLDIVLTGPAVHLLDEDTDDLVDGDDIAKFRAALKKLAIPFHVEEVDGRAGQHDVEGCLAGDDAERDAHGLVRAVGDTGIFGDEDEDGLPCGHAS